LNLAIKRQLEEHHHKPFSGRDYNRRQVFEEQEQPLLQQMPTEVFQVRKTVTAQVQKNYHVILGEGWHQYSGPFELTGKTLKVVYRATEVEIYHQMQRVAFYSRNRSRHGYSTLKEHIPENHRRYHEQKGWDEDYFKKQAQKNGPTSAPDKMAENNTNSA